MTPDDVLHTLDTNTWSPPKDTGQAAAALESGKVLFLPNLAFATLPSEQQFLTGAALDDTRKNISLDPKTNQIHGSGFEGDKLTTLTAMLDRFGRNAETLLHALLPAYAATLDRARTSFRPAEIAGREYSPRHDDRRLHVDAFPSRPMRGRRLLRLFANIAPDGAQRDWRVGEPFEPFARKFLPRLRPMLPGQAWAMQTLRLTRGRRTEYDHAMLTLHDAAKLDTAYQATAPKAAIAFPANTTWLCFTDTVLHAALAGHCALEQTFYIPTQSMLNPAQSPLKILERLTGRVLA